MKKFLNLQNFMLRYGAGYTSAFKQLSFRFFKKDCISLIFVFSDQAPNMPESGDAVRTNRVSPSVVDVLVELQIPRKKFLYLVTLMRTKPERIDLT